MSLHRSLKKLVDSESARQEEQRLEAMRDRREELAKGEPPHPPKWECRICGLKSERSDYCPECLAPTLSPI